MGLYDFGQLRMIQRQTYDPTACHGGLNWIFSFSHPGFGVIASPHTSRISGQDRIKTYCSIWRRIVVKERSVSLQVVAYDHERMSPYVST